MRELQKIVSKVRGKNVLIQLHNFPDPDAIASAYGLQYLLKLNDIDTTICYKGNIDRCNTQRMTQMFDIHTVNIDMLEDSIENSIIILVDAQKNNGNTYNMNCKNVISIDHHPVFKTEKYVYSDIRPEVGACASIIASYFVDNDIEIPVDVATALLYGIKIDTAQMTRGVSRLDMDMFYALFFRVDNERLSYLGDNTIQLEDLKKYGSAFETISVEDGISFADAGADCPEALVAEIADFMSELEGVRFTVVYSLRHDGIKFSVRSPRHAGYNAGEIIIAALDGLGTGGGHVTMAGGHISMIGKTESADEIISRVRANIKKLLVEIGELYA